MESSSGWLPEHAKEVWMYWNQLDALFIFNLFSHYTSTCFGFASCPSSSGNNVYTQQLVHVVRFSWLSADLVGMEWVPTLLPSDDGQLASAEHVEVQWLNKLKLNTGWSKSLCSPDDCKTESYKWCSKCPPPISRHLLTLQTVFF
jgi:hypothetical protein